MEKLVKISKRAVVWFDPSKREVTTEGEVIKKIKLPFVVFTTDESFELSEFESDEITSVADGIFQYTLASTTSGSIFIPMDWDLNLEVSKKRWCHSCNSKMMITR